MFVCCLDVCLDYKKRKAARGGGGLRAQGGFLVFFFLRLFVYLFVFLCFIYLAAYFIFCCLHIRLYIRSLIYPFCEYQNGMG